MLDIRLPRLDGWQVLADLQARPGTARRSPWSSSSVVDERLPGARPGRRRRTCSSRCSRDDLVGALRRVGALAGGWRPDVGRGRHDAARILVIEDNPLNLKLVRDVLEVAGYDVVGGATRGGGAACAAAELPPDLVLMDLQLPGIDGTETLQRLRQAGLAPEVPVVAVTAFAMTAGPRARRPGRLRRLPGEADQRPVAARARSRSSWRTGRR